MCVCLFERPEGTHSKKAPFFIQKLAIQTLPTLCFFIKGMLVGKQMGFEGFSSDEFKTIELARKYFFRRVLMQDWWCTR